MKFSWGMMRSESLHQVTHVDLQTSGFGGWWNPVEKLIGCIEWGKGKSTFIAQTLPWDGAAGGRLDTIIRHTDARNKRLVRYFFSQSKTLPPILGECIKHDGTPTPPPSRSCPEHQLILVSRYRDNIYICILNARDDKLSILQNIIELLLLNTYGIKLKWEPHGD